MNNGLVSRSIIALYSTLLIWGTIAYPAQATKSDAPSSFEQTKVKPEPNLSPLHIEDVELKSTGQNAYFQPGDRLELKLKLQLDEGFHAYIDQFKLKLIGPQDFYVSEPQIQPTIKFTDPISKKTKVGTQDYFEMVSLLDISPNTSGGKNKIELELTYQACGTDFCLLPKSIPVVKELHIQSSEKTTFQNALDKGWLYALIFVFVAGLFTSFTPCIFPMIPITLAVIGSRGASHSKWRGFVTSLVYVLGIAFTYSVLGIFAAKSGSLFGSYLGHPAVVSVIALVFIIMGLSMFGLFEIQAPQFVTQKLIGIKTEKNFFGAFVSGLIAGVVASPCVGPVLIGILTFVAREQNVLKGFVLLFTFAMGLGLIFLVLGTFHSILHKLPRSGPWMNHVKKMFGIIMFVMAAYYVYPVAKKPLEDLSIKLFKINPDSLKKKVAGPEWQNYSEVLLQKAISEKRPVIIDFHAEWCAACEELIEYTFSDPRVIEYGKNFLWLSFDATNPSDELDRLQKKYGIGGLPYVILYGADGQPAMNQVLTGFEDAESFLKRMHKVYAQ